MICTASKRIRNSLIPCVLPCRGFAVLAHKWAQAAADAQVPPTSRKRVVILLHGILGQKSNWNTPAKRLLNQIGPLGWQVLQIDHRAHGQSPAGEPPHTLQACAKDLMDTLLAAGVQIDDDELVVCGHSFGGKVALTFLQERLRSGAPPPRMTWLFDSIPGRPVEYSAEQQKREQSVSFVLRAVETVAKSGVHKDRSSLVHIPMEEQGLSKPLAQWVAQSVRTTPDGVQFSYDLTAVRALYTSYLATDLWNVLEEGMADIGVIVAGRNMHAWGSQNLKRLENCGPRVTKVTLESAGHNVHVDDLNGLLEALETTFT